MKSKTELLDLCTQKNGKHGKTALTIEKRLFA